MSDEKAAKKSKIEQFKENAKNDPDFKGFSEAKKFILHALKLQKGNVTATATMLGIGRTAIYNHCDKDEKFKAAFDDIKEMKLDFVENKLMQRIEEGSDALIMYVLSCQGADRGYQSIKKIDHSTNGKDLPAASPQLIFMSADNMSQDQIDKLIEQNQGANSNDIGT